MWLVHSLCLYVVVYSMWLVHSLCLHVVVYSMWLVHSLCLHVVLVMTCCNGAHCMRSICPLSGRYSTLSYQYRPGYCQYDMVY